MISFASTVAVPAWLSVVLVGTTAFGAFTAAIASVLNGWLALRRIDALDAQRTQREVAQHRELMAAVNSNKETP